MSIINHSNNYNTIYNSTIMVDRCKTDDTGRQCLLPVKCLSSKHTCVTYLNHIESQAWLVCQHAS